MTHSQIISKYAVKHNLTFLIFLKKFGQKKAHIFEAYFSNNRGLFATPLLLEFFSRVWPKIQTMSGLLRPPKRGGVGFQKKSVSILVDHSVLVQALFGLRGEREREREMHYCSMVHGKFCFTKKTDGFSLYSL